MLMRVMLVDDEPFILQGLSVIIDWEKEGYEIVKKASDGREALDYLLENEVDLIITISVCHRSMALNYWR